jgi:hypothetical protein
MNEQPDQFYSQILMFVFVGVAAYSYFFSKKSHVNNLDFFEIGYVMNDNVAVYEAPICTSKPASNPASKPALTQLQQDCIDAMIGLGMKKKEATKRMHDLFAKYQPKTIQEFIQVAFKHEHN